jgi:hypothetical protein
MGNYTPRVVNMFVRCNFTIPEKLKASMAKWARQN